MSKLKFQILIFYLNVTLLPFTLIMIYRPITMNRIFRFRYKMSMKYKLLIINSSEFPFLMKQMNFKKYRLIKNNNTTLSGSFYKSIFHLYIYVHGIFGVHKAYACISEVSMISIY